MNSSSALSDGQRDNGDQPGSEPIAQLYVQLARALRARGRGAGWGAVAVAVLAVLFALALAALLALAAAMPSGGMIG